GALVVHILAAVELERGAEGGRLDGHQQRFPVSAMRFRPGHCVRCPCRVVSNGTEANQATERHGPVLRENHEKVEDEHDGKPEDGPEAREVFPRKVDLFYAAGALLDVLPRQQRCQRRAVAILGVGQGPSLLLSLGES
ncbi:unnamed protein product, partial [Ectocarpus sp. 12 AP-2014]